MLSKWLKHDDPTEVIKQAAVLRMKYRRGEEKIRIPPEFLGVHPRNKGGIDLNMEAVLDISCGVPSQRVHIESASIIMDHNVERYRGDPLIVAVVSGHTIKFGAVVINQFMAKSFNALQFEL